VAVVPVGEERLNIATRTVQGETTRVRRRVVAQPVEQEVTLREEHVVVERRRPQQNGEAGSDAPPRQDVLSETVVEMSDSRQVPAVWKSVHVAEEVVLRRQVAERREKVRETVRRDVVEVEHDREDGRPDVATLEHEGDAQQDRAKSGAAGGPQGSGRKS
jgi:stress response protein YsnF